MAAAALAAALSGCSSNAIISHLPGDMGEPTDTPARPAVAYQYPAVHDMPPPRADQPLTDEQQVEMEKDLTRLRDRQEGRSDKNPATTAKKAQVPADDTEATGGKGNP